VPALRSRHQPAEDAGWCPRPWCSRPGDGQADRTVRLYDEGGLQDSNAFANLALAAYDGDTGCYVFYCDSSWEVQNDMLYDSRQDAEQMVVQELGGVRVIDA